MFQKWIEYFLIIKNNYVYYGQGTTNEEGT